VHDRVSLVQSLSGEEEKEAREESVKSRVKMVDFEGQKFVETFTVSVVSSTSSVGFVLGYLLQDYNLMRNLIFAGIVASVVVTLPSWPFLKRNPIAWREIDDEHPSAKEEDEIEEENEEGEKKDKKENVLKRMIRRVFV
jgi:signal peptidase complex subunit 1